MHYQDTTTTIRKLNFGFYILMSNSCIEVKFVSHQITAFLDFKYLIQSWPW